MTVVIKVNWPNLVTLGRIVLVPVFALAYLLPSGGAYLWASALFAAGGTGEHNCRPYGPAAMRLRQSGVRSSRIDSSVSIRSDIRPAATVSRSSSARSSSDSAASARLFER